MSSTKDKYEMSSERRTQLDAVRKLWEALGEVPVDKEERIEVPFLKFPVGTHREEIWHWFEDQTGVSVAYLMWPTDENTKPW